MPEIANGDQLNSDGDLLGDMCDNCPTVTNEHQTDIDDDSVGDACDVCPTIPNESQGDIDQDKIGDVCTIVLFQQMPINLMETAITLGMLAIMPRHSK